MTVSRFLIRSRFVVTSLFCVLPVDAFVNYKKEDKRADIQKMSEDTLHRLYKAEPPAKEVVEKLMGTRFSTTLEMAEAWPSITRPKGKPS